MGRARLIRLQLTARDRELLLFLAEHRLVLAAQAHELLRVSDGAAAKRLRALARDGYIVCRRIFYGQPACCQIRPLGLAAIGSDLPPPRLKLAYYEHDVGVAWIWLGAHRGAFGPLREVIGERRLRSGDGRLRAGALEPEPGQAGDEPAGVRLGGIGRGGRERLHYPDLLLVTAQSKRIAVELELSSKGRARLESILLGYAGDRRIDGVLYLVEDRPAGRALGEVVHGAARRLGLDAFVAVGRLRVNAPRMPSGNRERPAIDTRPVAAPELEP